jgi:hypothetical protein
MKRLAIVVLNLILIIAGFLTVYLGPGNIFAITLGMLLIAISMISFAVLIYFPPKTGYVKIKVVEEAPKTASRINQRPKRKMKSKRKAKRSRK